LAVLLLRAVGLKQAEPLMPTVFEEGTRDALDLLRDRCVNRPTEELESQDRPRNVIPEKLCSL
jgi:hypothetical protein